MCHQPGCTKSLTRPLDLQCHLGTACILKEALYCPVQSCNRSFLLDGPLKPFPRKDKRDEQVRKVHKHFYGEPNMFDIDLTARLAERSIANTSGQADTMNDLYGDGEQQGRAASLFTRAIGAVLSGTLVISSTVLEGAFMFPLGESHFTYPVRTTYYSFRARIKLFRRIPRRESRGTTSGPMHSRRDH